MDGDVEVNSLLNLNWLYIDQEGVLWEIGKKGKVFRYDQIHDCFNLVYKLPMESFSEQPDPITYAWLDEDVYKRQPRLPAAQRQSGQKVR